MQKIIDGLFWVLVVAVLLSFQWESPCTTMNFMYAVCVALAASVLLMILSKRVNKNDR